MILLPAQLAAAATLEGRVLERGTADPIAGAEVAVDGGAAVVSGADGGFVLAGAGDVWTVTFSSPNHERQVLEVTLPTEPVKVYLRPASKPLEVVIEAFRPSSHTTRHTVDAEQALETPGNLEDAVRLVQSLPGVAVTREYSPGAGTLSVRGSAPGDNRYLLDGIEVPYLYHFNQYASVFPATQVGRMDLYPSTFGAAYGDAVGAVVDVRSDLDVPKKAHGGAFVNFVLAGGDARAPLGRGWWTSASARRSYQDLNGEQTDQYTLWPVFGDYVLRVERGDEDNGSGLFLWGAGDSYERAAGELDLLDPIEASESPSFRHQRGFRVAGGRHRWSSLRKDGRAVLAVVDDRRRGRLSGNGTEDRRTVRLTSRVDANWRPQDDLAFAAGWEVHHERAALTVEDPGDAVLLVANEAPALARGAEVDGVVNRQHGGVYGETQVVAGPLRAMPGLRMAFDEAEVLPEPRLGLRVRAAEQTELRVGSGRYHQRPESEHLLPGTGDPDLPTTGSWQLGGGIDQTIAGRVEVQLDAYQKWLEDPLFYPVDGPAVPLERGDAWGVEAVTRYRLREVFFLWGWLGYQRSFVDLGRVRVPSDGDQPLSGGVVASWDLEKGWNLGARYRMGSGLPYTPLDGAHYDATRDTWIPRPGAENSARMPLYQKVDVRIAKTWTFRTWQLIFSLEVWYVPPPSAQLYPAWSYDYTQQGWVVGPSVLPLAGLRARF